MLSGQGYMVGQQSRRHTRSTSAYTGTGEVGGFTYSFQGNKSAEDSLKRMRRDCMNVKSNLVNHVTWLRVLSVLFVVYFFYKVSLFVCCV